MDFVSRLPRSPKGHFLSIRINYSLDQLAQLYVDEIVRLHDVPTPIVLDRDPKFTSHF